ncbi:hypothetical protein [Nocardia shimofusensis]|uniref:hypothetical protein n=1 Tax=Nocardia shimofusensis TaxID=228596 RepID=UPI00082FB7C6|nr:hypothetical protein [Nocardia shimofusensis]
MNRSRRPVFFAIVVAVVALVVGVLVIRDSTSEPPRARELTCLGGSEKSAFMADSEVRAVLREDYGIAVRFEERGSYDMVQIPTEQLRSRAIDCLWPASASARSVFEESHDTDDFPGYRAESVLETPEVIYAGAAATEALIRAGLVTRRDDAYYLVDFQRLLLDYVLARAKWDVLATDEPAGPIRITSTDPESSNSGFTLLQLELTVIASGDVYQPPTVEEARSGLPTVRALYDAQGLQSAGSDGGFREWLIQGASSLYAGYESQILQQLVAYHDNASATDALVANARMLYPEPTLFNSNPLLTLSEPARELIPALQDPRIQDIAWKRYGFRSATRLGAVQAADFPQIPLAAQPRATTPPRADVTQLLLACLRDNRCD